MPDRVSQYASAALYWRGTHALGWGEIANLSCGITRAGFCAEPLADAPVARVGPRKPLKREDHR
jgi:hypothetical protein